MSGTSTITPYVTRLFETDGDAMDTHIVNPADLRRMVKSSKTLSRRDADPSVVMTMTTFNAGQHTAMEWDNAVKASPSPKPAFPSDSPSSASSLIVFWLATAIAFLMF